VFSVELMRLTVCVRLDIHEDKEKNIITATFELPGMKKEDISIEVHHDHLSISGEANESSEKKEGDFTVRERKFGKFSRSVKLPKGVKPEDVTAKMEDGLLSVAFPATQPEDAPSRITIN
jgi:HSP20 family protein